MVENGRHDGKTISNMRKQPYEPPGHPNSRKSSGICMPDGPLDCLVGIAYQVSLDFVRRPEFYKSNITPEVSAQIVRLRIQYGTDVELPDMAQRARD